MIEGESDFVGEEDMMRAIEVGHAAVRDLCLGEPPPPPPVHFFFHPARPPFSPYSGSMEILRLHR